MMATHRVALVITDLEIGGAELCLTDLVVRLDRNRFEPVVFCLGPEPVVVNRGCLPILAKAGVEVHCLGAKNISRFPGVLLDLRRRLVRLQPALVQTFLFHANIVGRIAARRSGVRWVVSGIRVAERTQRWHLGLDRLTAKMVDCHVCVSEAVARFSATKGGLPSEKLVVIPNGIDLGRFPASVAADLRPFGISPGHRPIVYVGRMEPQKGLDWFLASAGSWLDRIPGTELLLVGDGPQRADLERISRQAGITARVHFAGWQPQIPEILAASRLLILPSRWEGMPNVVLQAMASRLPVLATDVEGVRELLGEGADAQTVPPGNASAIAGKLVQILSDASLAVSLGAQNRTRAEKRFDIHAMVAAYEGLWISLLDGERRT
jgi:glycosyltransferase involved in cell wall biosynthesis